MTDISEHPILKKARVILDNSNLSREKRVELIKELCRG